MCRTVQPQTISIISSTTASVSSQHITSRSVTIHCGVNYVYYLFIFNEFSCILFLFIYLFAIFTWQVKQVPVLFLKSPNCFYIRLAVCIYRSINHLKLPIKCVQEFLNIHWDFFPQNSYYLFAVCVLVKFNVWKTMSLKRKQIQFNQTIINHEQVPLCISQDANWSSLPAIASQISTWCIALILHPGLWCRIYPGAPCRAQRRLVRPRSVPPAQNHQPCVSSAALCLSSSPPLPAQSRGSHLLEVGSSRTQGSAHSPWPPAADLWKESSYVLK